MRNEDNATRREKITKNEREKIARTNQWKKKWFEGGMKENEKEKYDKNGDETGNKERSNRHINYKT